MQRATKYIRNRMMNGIRKKLRKGNMSICNSAGILANACQISIKFCVFRTKSDTNVSKFHGIRLNFSVSIKPSAIFLDSALFRIFWNLTNRKKNDLTKNISRVHFCVNVKRNRSRMNPRNPASKENRGLQLEEKLPSVSRNSALIQQCTDSTNYGRVLQVRSRGSAWTRPVRKGDRLLVLPFVSECW